MTASDPTPGPEEGEGQAPRMVLVVVFITILIDFIGFSILIPVLPLYAERLGATPLEIALILATYAVAQLLFLPAWGWVSDRIGRRPVILVSLLGTVASFVVLAFADSMAMIYLARALAGFFAASVGAAQAVVTDVTTPRERAHGMGMIGAAVGAGMIVGPVLGGVTAEIGEKIPFYTVAVLAAANFAAAWWRLPESRPAGLTSPPWSEFGRALVPTPFRLIVSVHDPRIGLYLYFFFHLFTGFAMLESLTSLYVNMRFGVGELGNALIFALIGGVLFLTQAVFLRRLVDNLGETRLVGLGILAMGVGLAAIAFATDFLSFLVIGPIIAVGAGMAFPTFTSLYSKACEAEQAGELLGLSQSMITLGRIVGPLVGGLAMTHWTLSAPFVIAATMMLAALLLLSIFRRTLVAGL